VPGTRSVIENTARGRFGERSRPAAIVLTHGHFDHVGALEDLARIWDAPVYAHPLEFPYLTGNASYPPGDPSVGGGLMASLSQFYPTAPVNVSAHLKQLSDDGSIPCMPGWRWLRTPGHSPGHISLWREADRLLIAGDAFITTPAESAYATTFQTLELHGPPQYFTIDWTASAASVCTLAALDPELVAPATVAQRMAPKRVWRCRRWPGTLRNVPCPRERFTNFCTDRLAIYRSMLPILRIFFCNIKTP
jgi:glyoxylase-like metal-dependent hydrolase (beta-lactamase superfamily II)